jgi:hypothetical protein
MKASGLTVWKESTVFYFVALPRNFQGMAGVGEKAAEQNIWTKQLRTM